MHPQILQTWPSGRQALAVKTHNFAHNNGKGNWSDNEAKQLGYKISMVFSICRCKR